MVTVLDGGMGKELERIGAPFAQPEWSALALLDDPTSVLRAHQNFIAAGAEIITVNAYAVVPFHLGQERFAARGRELADLAGQLARKAADGAPHPVRVAASIPPLFGSYEPDRFDPDAAPVVIGPLIDGQAPWADLWLIETIGSCAEARFAASALSAAGVGGERWFSFALADQPGSGTPGTDLDRPTLWSGESVAEAVEAAADGGADAILINCSAPEDTTLALAELARSLDGRSARSGAEVAFGAYANGFQPRPSDYSANEVVIDRRPDLTPSAYADEVGRWIELGATLVGGCCGIHPDHVAEVARRR